MEAELIAALMDHMISSVASISSFSIARMTIKPDTPKTQAHDVIHLGEQMFVVILWKPVENSHEKTISEVSGPYTIEQAHTRATELEIDYFEVSVHKLER